MASQGHNELIMICWISINLQKQIYKNSYKTGKQYQFKKTKEVHLKMLFVIFWPINPGPMKICYVIYDNPYGCLSTKITVWDWHEI